MSAPEKCQSLVPKSFLQLHSHTAVAKPLTGSLEKGVSPPDYFQSLIMLINWILKGRILIFSSTVADSVLVQAAQLRETQILFLSATDLLWESTQNCFKFSLPPVSISKVRSLVVFLYAAEKSLQGSQCFYNTSREIWKLVVAVVTKRPWIPLPVGIR